MHGWREGEKKEKKEGRKKLREGKKERKGDYKLPVSGIRMALSPQVLQTLEK